MSGFRMSDNALPPEATPPSAGLRYYQQELLDQAEAALQPVNVRVMLKLPTGGGKTHTAGRR